MRRRGGHPARQRMEVGTCGAGAGFDLIRMSGHPAASASSGPRKTGGGVRSSWQERTKFTNQSPASSFRRKRNVAGEGLSLFGTGYDPRNDHAAIFVQAPLIFAMTPVQPWRTARTVIEARLAEQGFDG